MLDARWQLIKQKPVALPVAVTSREYTTIVREVTHTRINDIILLPTI